MNFFETYSRHRVISVFSLFIITQTHTLSVRNHRLIVIVSLENTQTQN